MGERLIRQANGLFAVFSDTVGNLILYDADADGIVEHYTTQAAERAREAARLWVEGKAPGRRIYTVEQAMAWFDVLHDPELDEDSRSEAKATTETARAILENPDSGAQERKMFIGKFIIPVEDYATIIIPAGAKLLHVAEQHGELCLWALIDLTVPVVKRLFRVAGTGHPITGLEASWPFVGTGLLMGGKLVFHVFDGGEVEA